LTPSKKEQLFEEINSLAASDLSVHKVSKGISFFGQNI